MLVLSDMRVAVNLRHIDLEGIADHHSGPIECELRNPIKRVNSPLRGIEPPFVNRLNLATTDSLLNKGTSPFIQMERTGAGLTIKLATAQREFEVVLPLTQILDLKAVSSKITELRQFGEDVIRATYKTTIDGLRQAMQLIANNYHKLKQEFVLNDARAGQKTWKPIEPTLLKYFEKFGAKIPWARTNQVVEQVWRELAEPWYGKWDKEEEIPETKPSPATSPAASQP